VPTTLALRAHDDEHRREPEMQRQQHSAPQREEIPRLDRPQRDTAAEVVNESESSGHEIVAKGREPEHQQGADH
jgi:hypothetical protein